MKSNFNYKIVKPKSLVFGVLMGLQSLSSVSAQPIQETPVTSQEVKCHHYSPSDLEELLKMVRTIPSLKEEIIPNSDMNDNDASCINKFLEKYGFGLVKYEKGYIFVEYQ